MFKTILLAYDGSDHAQNAMKTAAGMVKAFDAKLHISHTPQIDTPAIVLGAMIDVVPARPSDAQVKEAGKHLMEKALGEAKSLGVSIVQIHLGRGHPPAEILEVADKINADLIIMGRRGLGSIRSLALGSTSLSVSHGAKCVCMTVI